MTWTSRRTSWSLLLGVALVPVLVLGLLALLGHTQMPPTPSPSPTPGIPLLQGQACGLGPTPSPIATSGPVPTLGPELPSPREGGAMGYDSVANNIVMLGGQTFPANAGAGASQTLNDAWTLDSLGWHQDHLVPNPTPGVIAQDPRTGHLIMVGSPLPTGLASADLDMGRQRVEAPGRPPSANRPRRGTRTACGSTGPGHREFPGHSHADVGVDGHHLVASPSGD